MPKKQWVQTTNMRYKKRDVKERFMEKVNRTSSCWLWTASTRSASDGFRYGQFSLDGYPEWAHRAAWRILRGPIPDGLVVCHTCDNPLCVNPEHLFLGTQKDNIKDMLTKGRDAIVGERNPSAKLTVASVLLARQLSREGGLRAKDRTDRWSKSSNSQRCY